MKYALVNGEKKEASKGAKGKCSSCGSDLIAKCGEFKVNHWAHKGNRNCDSWWENETKWHRAWKNKFPKNWQEVVHFDQSGEKHIADVKTDSNWVIEFQHSYIKPQELRSREEFYTKMVWIVDGTRRKRDKTQFQNKYEEGTKVFKDLVIKSISFHEECRLLEEWIDSKALVFFDFQNPIDNQQSDFWFLLPKTSTGKVLIIPYSRENFIKYHNQNTFGEEINKLFSFINKELERKTIIEQIQNSSARKNTFHIYKRFKSIKPRRGRWL